jgi:murein DD-endopeptidase MepM/ murein hydrolase activator NlpD
MRFRTASGMIYLFLFYSAFGISATAGNFSHLVDEKKPAIDTSYVYSLPYEKGKSHLLIQGSNSKFSHRNEIALDFKMKTGTPVCAMRDGIVLEVKEDSDQGGLKRKYYALGNYILIRHRDDSFAWYFHLQKNGACIEVGDTVKVGQIVGRSGNSGYSAFPHLHVEVVVREGERYKQIPIRFRIRNGDHYLKPGHLYRQTLN